MLFLIVVVVTGAAIVASEKPLSIQDLVMYEKNVEHCKSAEMPTPEDLDILLNARASLRDATQQGKCFMGCMVERAGFLSNGSIPRSDIEALIALKMKEKDQPVALRYLDECEKEMVGVSQDRCVAGPVIVECIRKFEAAMRT